jgi:catechol 2,3-dioxygenase
MVKAPGPNTYAENQAMPDDSLIPQPAHVSAPAGLRIGHTHLKVSDLDRSLAFWRDVIGLDVTARIPNAVFLSAGGYHHHIALNTWESLGGKPPAPGTTGLFHVALLYPDRPSLARALRALIQAGIRLDGASDHGVSEALYLRDPDDNGVELYWDRPREEWPYNPDGSLNMYTRRLDLQSLMAEAEG